MNKSLVLTIFLAAIISIAIGGIAYGDTIAGWNGYGIYTLSKADSSVIEENIDISAAYNNLTFNGQYTVKNNSSEDIKVVLATPNNNISGFKVFDKDTNVRYRSRSYEGIKAEYNLDGKIPKEPKWYTFEIYLKPNEIKTVRVTFTSKPTLDSKGIMQISYMQDRQQNYSNAAENVKLNISLEGYKPYNIIALDGIEPNQINEAGSIKLEYDSTQIKAVALKYQAIDNLMLESLKQSSYKNPKEIAYAFSSKDYNKAIVLCNQYLENPLDKKLSIEQIKLIKAESYRLLSEADKYLSSIEKIDLNKIYPENLIYKILYDKIMIFQAKQDNEGLLSTINELKTITQNQNTFIASWFTNNGFDTPEPTIVQAEEKLETLTVIAKDSFPFNELYNKILEYKYSLPAALLIGLLLGFVIGRASKRNKRSGSMYLFRK